eukprot:GILJ01011264.1.p1 GENE.GILJ01011264.1~~GILJ01011264.1.p1  ORF type:complete len:867 (-),score=164.52 GILJ01011264.1:142-2421(-)
MTLLQHRWSCLYMLLRISENLDQEADVVAGALQHMFSPHSGLAELTNGHVDAANRTKKSVRKSINGAVNSLAADSPELLLPLRAAADKQQKPAAAAAVTTAETAAEEVTEALLLRDVLFAFQGIDGRFVRYNANADGYQIEPTVHLSAPVRELICRLSELGWMFRHVCNFVNSKLDEGDLGLIAQSFCFSIQDELTDYYKLLAVLEGQVRSDLRTDSKGSSPDDSSILTLRKLYVWSQEPLERLRWMAILVDAVKGLKGGALISTLHGYMKQGDPTAKAFVNRLLNRVCVPLFTFIRKWMLEGELTDSHQEFFISADNSVTSDQRLWSHKYKLNLAMLPSFFSQQLAYSILLTGKSINFLRICCGEPNWMLNRETEVSEDTLAYGNTTALETWVTHAADKTNKRVVRLLFDKYQFQDHFRALRSYLLLGQGDFIQYLMDLLASELNKPAGSLYRHNLTGVMETAIRSSNAQFEKSDILARVDIKLLEPSPGDCGWDVFSLDYRVEAPLHTIFTPEIMQEYLRIFNFLWRLKRIDHRLSAVWNQQMTAAHALDRVAEIRGDLHLCHLLRHEMLHFVSNLHNYLMLEVLETSWQDLQENLRQSSNLDELIAAHAAYLQTIVDKAVLNESTATIRMHLSKLFDLILRFSTTQDLFITTALEEVHQRQQREVDKKLRSDKGLWGTVDHGVNRTHTPIAAEARAQLFVISKEYALLLEQFRHVIDQQAGDNFKFLAFRLDFNEFYQKQKDKDIDQSDNGPAIGF